MKYSPHDYQSFATDFILAHPASAIFLDCGLGKSVITLTALFDLCLDSFLVRKVLVIAPEDTLGCSRTEKDLDTIRALWQEGYFDGRRELERVREFWTKE